MARVRNEIKPESRSEGDDEDADANEIVWRFIPFHRQQPRFPGTLGPEMLAVRNFVPISGCGLFGAGAAGPWNPRLDPRNLGAAPPPSVQGLSSSSPSHPAAGRPHSRDVHSQ